MRCYEGAPVLQLSEVLYGSEGLYSHQKSAAKSSSSACENRKHDPWVLLRFPRSFAEADRSSRGDARLQDTTTELTCCCDGSCGLIDDIQGTKHVSCTGCILCCTVSKLNF
jgi:hypothetical protein